METFSTHPVFRLPVNALQIAPVFMSIERSKPLYWRAKNEMTQNEFWPDVVWHKTENSGMGNELLIDKRRFYLQTRTRMLVSGQKLNVPTAFQGLWSSNNI